MSAPHFLYRCFDAAGVLLYIGCTSNVERRMKNHRHEPRHAVSRWLRVSMSRHEVEGPFPDRTAGLAAEAEAIASEQPLFNFQRRATLDQAPWMTRSAVARYLIDHGHLELALATTCSCERETREAGGFDEWCPAHVARGAAA